MDFSYANGDQILRDIRLQKTKNEIDIMRFSARANAEAGLAAAMKVRAGASLSDVRQAYYQECFKRHLKPSFIIVDGNASEFSDDKIVEGRSFLIDCVSSGLGYHGDYGRTVCLGEPTKGNNLSGYSAVRSKDIQGEAFRCRTQLQSSQRWPAPYG